MQPRLHHQTLPWVDQKSWFPSQCYSLPCQILWPCRSHKPHQCRTPTTSPRYLLFWLSVFLYQEFVFILFMFLIDYSHIQIAALGSLWTGSESNIWVRRIALVRWLEPLPRCRGCSAQRCSHRQKTIWSYLKQPERPSCKGLWHTSCL